MTYKTECYTIQISIYLNAKLWISERGAYVHWKENKRLLNGENNVYKFWKTKRKGKKNKIEIKKDTKEE